MRAPLLRTICLSSRRYKDVDRPAMPSALPQEVISSQDESGGRGTVIAPACIADFIKLIECGPELPELRVDEPYVSLIQAATGLKRLAEVVSKIQYTL
ncbi:hypothetical protein AURDEDRAFT_112325 [Auricularia subglabra TFB-10046 SS5]|nr:hypothetical protein AURDEDRAFT_112325 [Auricularia subglabra TFB-10046 SS5]